MSDKEISRGFKQFLMAAGDMVWLPLALWLAIVLRWGDQPYNTDIRDLLVYIFGTLFTMLVFMRLGLYRSVIRFMGTEAIIAVIKGISISALIVGSLVFLTRAEGIPRSIPFIYWGLALFFVGGSRFIVWNYYQAILKKECEVVAIYGAGDAGRQLLVALRQSGEYEAAVFIDDNRKVKGRIINGVQVYRPRHLENLIAKKGITQVLMAMPSVSAQQKKKIIALLEPLPVHVKTIPVLADIVSGKAKIEELREIDIEDLLGRDSVVPDARLFEHCIKNKVVLVSGAGGSIGSELCRQIIKYQPQHLILFELSEYALYSMEQELKKLLSVEQGSETIHLTALLGSVQDKKLLQSIFTAYGVDTVYHAAAYKHVPIVEENIVEGIRNNIFGTCRAAEAAYESDVETFVLISTDKAVRPTNVMGTTKRFAEMVLQGMAKKYAGKGTRFCMVRFGNVLGSSGSVVPLFTRQIKHGGPVTVTDPNIIRYFMTIPEASQLVLQAGSLAQGGDVFVLDMGEAIKIVDLAKKMIHLSGYEVQDESNPDGDISIEYTGLRPGEKLYEELLIGDNVSATEHPRIMRAEEKMLPLAVMDDKMALLDEACNDFNISWVREILLDSETGYVPDKDQPVDLLWCELKKKSARN
ncbi:MAG: polysaccharide biosynthesis protein [gamma proteobacterium symbiont of Taylorina sp.]|nr:polysaccharide biosynthesis protein [gamma proteobacterium symbiont of Taylorina sp.]